MCEKTGIKILYEIQIFVMTDNTITTDKLIIALLTGAALGVVIGMLLAPEKGTELRKRISDIAENIADRLADFFFNRGTKSSSACCGRIFCNS